RCLLNSDTVPPIDGQFPAAINATHSTTNILRASVRGAQYLRLSYLTMLPVQLIVALLAGLAIVVLLYVGARSLAGQTTGRVVLLVGLVALPLLLSAGNISYGFHQSSTTNFCLSCHEMRD